MVGVVLHHCIHFPEVHKNLNGASFLKATTMGQPDLLQPAQSPSCSTCSHFLVSQILVILTSLRRLYSLEDSRFSAIKPIWWLAVPILLKRTSHIILIWSINFQKFWHYQSADPRSENLLASLVSFPPFYCDLLVALPCPHRFWSFHEEASSWNAITVSGSLVRSMTSLSFGGFTGYSWIFVTSMQSRIFCRTHRFPARVNLVLLTCRLNCFNGHYSIGKSKNNHRGLHFWWNG